MGALLGGCHADAAWGFGGVAMDAVGREAGGGGRGGGGERVGWNGSIEMRLCGDEQRERFVQGVSS